MTVPLRQKPTRRLKIPRMVTPEGQIVKMILEVLSTHPKYKHRVKVFRNNTGAVVVKEEEDTLDPTKPFGIPTPKKSRFVRFGQEGSPDIIGFIAPSGRFLGIEVKTKTGKVSESQAKWIQEAVQMGAVCTVVRSVEETMQFLDDVLGEDL